MKKPSYVMFLAVLPKYRLECIEILRRELGEDLQLFVSPAHLDPSVKTGLPHGYYRQLLMIRIFRRAFLQVGGGIAPLLAGTVILDLNPRSLSAWIILLIRAIARKRTLLWGHIHPQSGPNSRTSGLRRMMRKLATGSISYTYTDQQRALEDISAQKVWVAPNSLYGREFMFPSKDVDVENRNSILYVGRFEKAKKIDLLIRGFSEASNLEPEMHLTLVGGGSQEQALRDLVAQLQLSERVTFAGWIDDKNALRKYYDVAFCSASPGFAGLGLTQSLAFGIDMIVADQENHSPEIELADSGGVHWFRSDSSTSLAAAILNRWEQRGKLPNNYVAEFTRDRYSAEAMADGIIAALTDDEYARERAEQ